MRVCVYAASSRSCDGEYMREASSLGTVLAAAGASIVYGGSAYGPMGRMADAALDGGARVVGILPRFMYDLEWGHTGLTELLLVDDLHERKRQMITNVDAIVALPGGSGTLEELLEAITWKRLGLHGHPIVMVNVRDFYDPLVGLLEHAIGERFMDGRHAAMWSLVGRSADVPDAIRSAPRWGPEARGFATV